MSHITMSEEEVKAHRARVRRQMIERGDWPFPTEHNKAMAAERAAAASNTSESQAASSAPHREHGETPALGQRETPLEALSPKQLKLAMQSGAHNPKLAMFAKGRLKTGKLNDTEQAYQDHLQALLYSGDIVWFKFEGVKLRLADNTFYSPDFAVLTKEGFMEMHEVKGYWMDDARAKIKIAAEQFPFRFIAVQKRAKKHGGGFSVEEFSE